MVPVKIECDCGQHYAFEVEPVNGCMPSAVACPGCGADGTHSANEAIIRHLGPRATQPAITVAASAPRPAPAVQIAEPPAAVVIAPKTQLHVSQPASAPAAATHSKSALHASQFGLVSREQAEVEARAKISWGDPPEAVIKFLMIQGFTHPEASEMVEEMFKVRRAETRANGIKKTMMGGGMMCVPVVALIFFLSIHYIPIKIMGAAIGVGLWGLIKVIQGLIMILAPKMETGDVADQ